MEPSHNEPLYNEDPAMTNNIFQATVIVKHMEKDLDLTHPVTMHNKRIFPVPCHFVVGVVCTWSHFNGCNLYGYNYYWHYCGVHKAHKIFFINYYHCSLKTSILMFLYRTIVSIFFFLTGGQWQSPGLK